MVVMDKKEYIQKAEDLLEKQQTYRTEQAQQIPPPDYKHADNFNKEHLARKRLSRPYDQKDAPHWCRAHKILRASQGTQNRGFPQAYSVQQGHSKIWCSNGLSRILRLLVGNS